MPRYELVLDGVLADETVAELAGFAATREDDTTILRGELSSPDDLRGLLEAFETLGLGLQSLRRVPRFEDWNQRSAPRGG